MAKMSLAAVCREAMAETYRGGGVTTQVDGMDFDGPLIENIKSRTPVSCPVRGCLTSFLFTETQSTLKDADATRERRLTYLRLCHNAGRHDG